MHHWSDDNTIINYDADLRGNVIVTDRKTGDTVTVKAQSLWDFIVERIKEAKAETISQMSNEDFVNSLRL